MGISIIERGESFYQDKMNEVVKELEDRNVLEDDNGRKLMFADGADVRNQDESPFHILCGSPC